MEAGEIVINLAVEKPYSMEKKKLRVAVLTRSFKVSSWKYYAVEEIIKSGIAEIAFTAKFRLQSSEADKKWDNAFLYRSYLRLEKLKWKGSAKASVLKNIKDLFTEKQDTVKFDLEKTEGCYQLKEDGLSRLVNARLDVIYLLDYIPLRFESANPSRFGVWYNHFGMAGCRGESLVGLWEFLKGSPFIFSGLRAFQTHPLQEQILYESKGPVNRFSINATGESCFWKSAGFAHRKLNELYRKQTLSPIRHPESEMQGNNHKIPDLTDLMRVNLVFMKRYLKEKFINRLYSQKWGLQFQFNSQETSVLNAMKPLLPPKNKFWADPFVYKNNERYYIFLEESYTGKKKKGFISVSEINSKGVMSQPRKVIERSYHMSYPFVFQHLGKHYMIPETNQNYTIELYQCKEFPYHWEFVKNLKEHISAVDTTLFFHNSTWWIFTNMKEHKQASLWDELFLFYTDDPISSDWTPHPDNPIVSDVTKARSAGKIFTQNNKIFRPAQNCSYRYGYGLSIQEITDLTPSSYKEIESISYTPKDLKGISGLHTFNKSDGLTIIDAVMKKKKIIG